jgi:hypothetical protein
MTIQGRGEALAIGIPSVLLAGFLVFAGYGWFQEHDARLKADAAAGQQQQQIDVLKQQQAADEGALKQKLAAIDKARQAPATATELATDAGTIIPNLPAPLQVTTASPDPEQPNAPPMQQVVIPTADFKAIRDQELTCEEDAAKLTSCQSNQTSLEQQLTLTGQQRDEYKTAAKGGSLWHRALGAAKWFTIGAGTGAGLYAVAHHK